MPASPVRVFIVDDSAPLADMLGELLADPGRVEIAGTAASVAAAIAGIEAERPDVVVVDLQLPDGSGFDVAEAIGRMPAPETIEIVFLSNHVAPELARRAHALGARHFLDKSRDHAVIVDIVQQKAAARAAES